jgi:hypothetical protein
MMTNDLRAKLDALRSSPDETPEILGYCEYMADMLENYETLSEQQRRIFHKNVTIITSIGDALLAVAEKHKLAPDVPIGDVLSDAEVDAIVTKALHEADGKHLH